MQSILDLTSKPPIADFEGFVIRPFDGWRLWMENSEGEGTTIPRIEFLVILDKLFKKNF